MCLASARVVQRYVFDQVDDPRLHGFLVWGPMLDDDDRADALRASRFMDDPRSSHFWTDDDLLAARFSAAAGLPDGELAWDTFLLFAPGQVWQDGGPPQPALAMHVGKSLPAEQRLHGPTLQRQVRDLLDGAAQRAGSGDR